MANMWKIEHVLAHLRERFLLNFSNFEIHLEASTDLYNQEKSTLSSNSSKGRAVCLYTDLRPQLTVG